MHVDVRLAEMLCGSLDVLYHTLQLRYLLEVALDRLAQLSDLLDVLLELVLNLLDELSDEHLVNVLWSLELDQAGQNRDHHFKAETVEVASRLIEFGSRTELGL